MNSTVISSQALTRPNWTLGEEEPELEELAEASLLQHHQERAESGEETEAASDVEAGEHSGGGQVEQQVPDPGQREAAAGDERGGGRVSPLPMPVQQEDGAVGGAAGDQSAGGRAAPPVQREEGTVGGAKQKVPQAATGDSSMNHTNFPPPKFCSGCGFIGTTTVKYYMMLKKLFFRTRDSIWCLKTQNQMC